MTKKVIIEEGTILGTEKQLVVIGEKRYVSAGKQRHKLIVKCSICSKDPEMYGEAIFESNRYDLLQNKMPCGCSPVPRYSLEQWQIMMKRKAESQDYIYHGYDGDWLGQNTQLNLSCNKCGNYWSTCSAANFVRNRTCPSCAYEVRRLKRIKADEDYIAEFKEMSIFEKGTIFERSGGEGVDRRMWNVICPSCPGKVFKSDRSNLLAGKRPCDCNSGGGFDRKLPGTVYVLKAVKEGTGFTGFGISNFPMRRLTGHLRELHKAGVHMDTFAWFDFDGQTAFDIESEIKATFPIVSQNVTGFIREATHLEKHSDLLNFVKDRHKQYESMLHS